MFYSLRTAPVSPQDNTNTYLLTHDGFELSERTVLSPVIVTLLKDGERLALAVS